MNMLIIGTAGDPRVARFNDALESLGLPSARLITYLDLMAGRIHLADCIDPGTIVRIESPGRDPQTNRTFLRSGALLSAAEGYRTISDDAVDVLPLEQGAMMPFRQWYLGFRHVLEAIRLELNQAPPHHIMNPPADIVELFDKRAVHARLTQARIPVPRTLPAPANYDDLRHQMESHHLSRVFIKLAHASSGAGIVALQIDRAHIRAFTTIELTSDCSYNTRQVRALYNEAEIARLIDYLTHDRLHVEAWLPKAAFDNHTFDLRIVVIVGQARHSVMRLSKHPITNLHLLNRRAPVSHLIDHIGTNRWNHIQHSAESAAACYPDCLYVGVDLAVNHRYENPTILEINAFGDLLKDVYDDHHQSTYQAEIEQCLTRIS